MTESKPNLNLVSCPYCDGDAEPLSLCQACRMSLFFCPHCGALVGRGEASCPSCQGEIGRQPDSA